MALSGGRLVEAGFCLSALKHGFYRSGFMLCDRCVLNAKCESIVPRGECAVERKAYDSIVSELVAQYGLEGLADEVLAGRVAMYLVRIARTEIYEASIGFAKATVIWGEYIVRLDKILRALSKDLVLTRADRALLDKDNVLVDIDRLLASLSAGKDRKQVRLKHRLTLRLLRDWRADKPMLLHFVRSESVESQRHS